MPSQGRKRRIPALKYTTLRGIGWHVSYRDRETGMPRKERFGMVSRAEAERAYYTWMVAFLGNDAEALAALRGAAQPMAQDTDEPLPPAVAARVEAEPGALVHIASGLIQYEEGRVRQGPAPWASGTISPQVAADRKKDIKDFLKFLNERHGNGAVARMRLEDLSMADVEAYNRQLVQKKFSVNTLQHKMQVIKRIADRAGRPEYGEQVLRWNWDALDRAPGRAAKQKQLPSLEQLKKLLAETDVRGKAFIWMGIGLGFGQSDLAAIRVGDIDKQGYDLRRGKTGIDRYGETPPGVWRAIQAYLKAHPRPKGAELFVTNNGQPLVHTRSDSILQWWNRLRTRIGETKETLDGFYVLRHLGATEFGSRDGCSISAMKRWLGHSASSSMADVYMRPVSPEHRAIVEAVRKGLLGKPKDSPFA